MTFKVDKDTVENWEEITELIPVKHETVKVYNPEFHEFIEIDKEIAELIKALWEKGIVTYNSCQENKPGIIWIDFPYYDGETFLNILCSRHYDHIYESIVLANYQSEWRLDVVPNDLSEFINENDEVETEGPPEIVLSLSIRFPKKDYPEVLKRIKQWEPTNRTHKEGKKDNTSN
ncbi:hypothetical protein [uncultured Draconibacterium sp.]|uniref:hypothetical protein n=1 Tax=uncultured Draconibacterium sp. TaxID=1573823 RepID=UPI0032616356